MHQLTIARRRPPKAGFRGKSHGGTRQGILLSGKTPRARRPTRVTIETGTDRQRETFPWRIWKNAVLVKLLVELSAAQWGRRVDYRLALSQPACLFRELDRYWLLELPPRPSLAREAQSAGR